MTEKVHFTPDPALEAIITDAASKDVEIIYAIPDDSYVSGGLRHLTSLLVATGLESGYGLGGENGYGVEYENDVFEMHPFYWGTCECGFSEKEADWEDANPHHLDDCYQSELDRRGGYPAASDLAKEWGMSEYGCAIHCTCGKTAAYEEWLKENDHDPTCPVVLPNFRHKRSGSTVIWYKYIGRSNEVDLREDWTIIMAECQESIR